MDPRKILRREVVSERPERTSPAYEIARLRRMKQDGWRDIERAERIINMRWRLIYIRIYEMEKLR